MIYKLRIFLFFLVALLPATVFAQADISEALVAPAAVTVKAKDLGVAEPKILPGSPLYWVKEVIRSMGVAMRFKPDAKAREVLENANERLIEIQKLAEQKGQVKEKTLKNLLEKYQQDITQVRDILEKNDNPNLKKKYIDQEFTRQRIFDAVERLESSDTISEFQQRSMETYAKLLFEAGVDEGKKQLKEYVDTNIKFDAKSLQDTKILEKAQTALADKDNQKAFGEIREYAIQKITDDLKNLDAEAQAQKIREFLKVESEDEGALDPRSIIEKIILEKARLDEEFRSQQAE